MHNYYIAKDELIAVIVFWKKSHLWIENQYGPKYWIFHSFCQQCGISLKYLQCVYWIHTMNFWLYEYYSINQAWDILHPIFDPFWARSGLKYSWLVNNSTLFYFFLVLLCDFDDICKKWNRLVKNKNFMFVFSRFVRRFITYVQ